MRLILFLVFCALPPTLASQAFVEGISDYDGNVGDKPIRMSLVAADARNELAGSYFYKNDLKDIPLRGSVHERDVVLQEYADDGRLRVTFRLFMPERDPKGRLSGVLDGDVLTGEWRDSPESKPITVYLALNDVLTGERKLTSRYESTGATSDAELEGNVRAFCSAVLRGDRTAASGFVRYPLLVNGSQKARTIRTKANFIRDYDLVFSAEYVQCIRRAIPHNMFVHNGEVMLGNGEVWFDGQGLAVSLNTCAPR